VHSPTASSDETVEDMIQKGRTAAAVIVDRAITAHERYNRNELKKWRPEASKDGRHGARGIRAIVGARPARFTEAPPWVAPAGIDAHLRGALRAGREIPHPPGGTLSVGSHRRGCWQA
jgi:hypothetical protein